ncbi:uncharacterized protein HD556DRAFT_1442727 [Suillus plorans]|uniref:Uncharacterized protein n=1 Tax=Suillus plorans TaxID=116603 RepID=A0A9P7DIT3_9AGAM|nr:uncharacterized protein HD556DRAFT_1442727 [Suillus plorans]KAG1794538.1 hypothetical protein HD556DRAFT_1442727 [Suillus plorans]
MVAPPASVIADAILPACTLQLAPPPTPAPNAPSQVHQLHVHSARAQNASTSVDAMQTHADDTRRRKDKRIEEGRRDGIEMKEERGTRGDETLGTLKVSTHIEDSTPSNNNDVICVTSPAPIFVRPALAPPPAFTPMPPSTTPTPPSTTPTPPSTTPTPPSTTPTPPSTTPTPPSSTPMPPSTTPTPPSTTPTPPSHLRRQHLRDRLTRQHQAYTLRPRQRMLAWLECTRKTPGRREKEKRRNERRKE